MTELQKTQYEMLKIFIDICEEFNLMYYLVCGSALGAIKYGGFIPWDDDIDVGMPRNDYEKFLEISCDHLPEHIFVQNIHTELDYPQIGTKLRHSDTTYLEKDYKNLKINQGVFIDIFPLDGYPTHPKDIKIFEKRKKYLYRRRFTKLYSPLHKDVFLTLYSLLYKFFGWFSDTNKACREYESLVKMYPIEKSTLWCNHANSISAKEYSPSWHYGQGTFVQFENLQVRVPEHYDEYLKLKYGNYEEDIPESLKKKGQHCNFLDLNSSYKNYI